MDRNQRINALMATTIQSWPDTYVPLTVRYRAAQAADDILEEWFALVGELDREDRMTVGGRRELEKETQ